LGLNPKTVMKWRKRATVEKRKTGPKDPRAVAAAHDVPAPQTDLAAAAVSRAPGLLPQPEPMISPLQDIRLPVPARAPNRERIGRILGVFETNVRRWVMIENRSGRITIIEPGDRIESGHVCAIRIVCRAEVRAAAHLAGRQGQAGPDPPYAGTERPDGCPVRRSRR
jgi:hypothetical protein